MSPPRWCGAAGPNNVYHSALGNNSLSPGAHSADWHAELDQRGRSGYPLDDKDAPKTLVDDLAGRTPSWRLALSSYLDDRPRTT
jgi:hypothetical protein